MGVVLPASSKSQLALPDVFYSCDVDVSALTGMRTWGKALSQAPSQKYFFDSKGFGRHFLVLLIRAHLEASRNTIMVPKCLSRKGPWQASHCNANLSLLMTRVQNQRGLMACPRFYSLLVPEHVLELKFNIFKNLSWFSFWKIFIKHILGARHCARHIGKQTKVRALKGLTIWLGRQSLTK